MDNQTVKERFAKKYLSDYIEEKQKKLTEELGGFYAFNNEQFKEQAQQGVKYVRYASFGFILPKNNIDKFEKGLENIIKKGIEQDKKEHTKEQIIWRELANYEVQYNYREVSQLIEHFKDYDYTKKDLLNEYDKYINYCIDNDLI